MIIGELLVEEPTVMELGLLVKEIDDGRVNEVSADPPRRVVPNGRKTSGPETLKENSTPESILSASKTRPPVTLKTVVFAVMPMFPTAAPVAEEERITTADDEGLVEAMVVVPPPQALNSMVL